MLKASLTDWILSSSLKLEYVTLIEDSLFAFLSRDFELSVVLSSRMEQH